MESCHFLQSKGANLPLLREGPDCAHKKLSLIVSSDAILQSVKPKGLGLSYIRSYLDAEIITWGQVLFLEVVLDC